MEFLQNNAIAGVPSLGPYYIYKLFFLHTSYILYNKLFKIW